MEIVSARDFRSNQTVFLNKALKGESVLLTSRIGTFKIVPVTEDDSITSRIKKGLNEVKLMQDGKIKGYTIDEALNEL